MAKQKKLPPSVLTDDDWDQDYMPGRSLETMSESTKQAQADFVTRARADADKIIADRRHAEKAGQITIVLERDD